jgi:hypothetical protein
MIVSGAPLHAAYLALRMLWNASTQWQAAPHLSFHRAARGTKLNEKICEVFV